MNDRQKLKEVLENLDKSVLVEAIYNCVFTVVPNIREVPPIPEEKPTTFKASDMQQEAELMTLQEALHKMKPGDKFQPLSNSYFTMEMSLNKIIVRSDKGEDGIIGMSLGNLGIKGKIIPAEPKVFNYSDWVNSPKIRGIKPNHRQAYEAGAEGQWLNHKELMEAVEAYFVDSKYDSYKPGLEMHDYIVGLIKNLKPLKAE